MKIFNCEPFCFKNLPNLHFALSWSIINFGEKTDARWSRGKFKQMLVFQKCLQSAHTLVQLALSFYVFIKRQKLFECFYIILRELSMPEISPNRLTFFKFSSECLQKLAVKFDNLVL